MLKLISRLDGSITPLQDVVVTPKVVLTLNELNMLQFIIPYNKETKTVIDKIKVEDKITVEDDQEYTIKEIIRETKLDVTQIEVVAIQSIDEFLTSHVKSCVFTNTLFHPIFLDYFGNTGYEVIYHGEGDKRRDLNITDVNLYELLQYLQEQFGFEFTLDNKLKKLHIWQDKGTYKGTYITTQLNLDEVKSTEDSHELYTRIIPIGKDDITIASVNDGKHYVENFEYTTKILTKTIRNNNVTSPDVLKDLGLMELEKYYKPYRAYQVKFRDLARLLPDKYDFLDYELGDKIKLLDPVLKSNEIHRIVEVTQYLFDKGQSELQLANKRYTLDKIERDYNKYIDSLVDNMGDISNPTQLIPDITDPDQLPPVPVITGKGMFATIMLEWTFKRWDYLTYELCASRTKGFQPGIDTQIFSGKASAFLHEVNPKEDWYYRVRATNSHGRSTDWSEEIGLSTYKIADGTKYFEELAIGHALIRDIDADKITVGKLKGQYIDAKNLTVTDGNGVKTLEIDSFGNVAINSNNITLKGQSVVTGKDVDDKISKVTLGGTNLLKNSAFKEDFKYWNIINSEKEGKWELTTFQGIKCIKFTDVGWWDISPYLRPDVFNVMKDDSVVVSMNLYMTKGTKLSVDFTNQLDWADTFIEVTKLNEWQRVEAVTTRPARDTGISTFSLYAGNRNERISGYLAFPQAEIGNKASGWAPSNKDVNSELGQFQSKVNEFEQKITPEQLSVTMSENFYTKGETREQFATKSFVEMESNEIRLGVSRTGRPQLIPNGDFRNQMKFWLEWESKKTLEFISKTESYVLRVDPKFTGKTAFGIQLPAFSMVTDKIYTVAFWVESTNIKYLNYNYIMSNNIGVKKIGDIHFDTQGGIMTRVSLTFQAPYTADFHIMVGWEGEVKGGEYFHISEACCYEGKVAYPYAPCTDEIYAGITYVDQTGVGVRHVDGGYSKLTADSVVFTDIFEHKKMGIKRGSLYAYDDKTGDLLGMFNSNRVNNAQYRGVTTGITGSSNYYAIGYSKELSDDSQLSMTPYILMAQEDLHNFLGYGTISGGINFMNTQCIFHRSPYFKVAPRFQGGFAIQKDNGELINIYHAKNSIYLESNLTLPTGGSFYGGGLYGGAKLSLGLNSGGGYKDALVFTESIKQIDSNYELNMNGHAIWNSYFASTVRSASYMVMPPEDLEPVANKDVFDEIEVIKPNKIARELDLTTDLGTLDISKVSNKEALLLDKDNIDLAKLVTVLVDRVKNQEERLSKLEDEREQFIQYIKDVNFAIQNLAEQVRNK